MSCHAQGVAYKVVWENPMHGSCIGNSYRRKAYLPGGGSRDPRVLKTVAHVKAARKWGNGKVPRLGDRARRLPCDLSLACCPRPPFALGARARCLYLAPSPCDFWAVLQVVLAWKDAGRRRFPRSTMSVASRACSKPPRSPDSCQNQSPFSAKPSRSRGVLALGIERLRLRLISGRRCAQWKGVPCQGLLLCVFVR